MHLQSMLDKLSINRLTDFSQQKPCHHVQIEGYLEEYAAKYWVAKQPRKLVWKRHLGAVELTLRVGSASRDFTVPPFEAAILMSFQVTHLPGWHTDSRQIFFSLSCKPTS